MKECHELENKTIRKLKIFDEPGGDPEVVIEFEDGTVFSAAFIASSSIEAKHFIDEGGEPRILEEY